MSPDILQTPETLSHLEVKFTPDDLIKKLESVSQCTVNQKECDDHKRLIEHIKALKIGTEGVTEKWWKQLRDGLSDADKKLASNASGSEDITKKLGIETALDAAKKGVDASVKKATEKAEQAKKLLESGDISKGTQMVEDAAKKAAAVAGVSVGAVGIGEIIRQAADGIMKPLKALSDMIGEMFKMLFGPIINMFKGMWGGFSGKTEENKGEGAVKDGLDKAKNIIQMSPEDREKARENMVSEVERKIKETWLYDEGISSGRVKELRKIIGEHEFPEEVLRQFASKVQTDGVGVSDLAGLVEKTVFNQSGLVLKLALAGVIPMKKIGIAVIDAETKGAKTYFALTLDGLGIPPSTFGFDELQKIAESNNDPQKRASMLYLLYKPASVFSSIVGGIIGNATSLAIGLSTDTTVDGIKMAKDVWYGHRNAQYGELIENFSKLEKNLRIPVGDQFAVGIRSLQNLTGHVTNNYRVLELLEKYKGDVAGFVKDPVIMNVVDPLELKTMTNATSETELRRLVGTALSKGEAFNYAQDMKNWAAKVGGSGGGRIVEQMERLNSILKVQGELAVQEWAALKYVKALRDVKEIATISRVQDTTILMAKDEQSLSKLGPALGKLGAEGIKHLFNGAPLIGLAVASHGLLNDKTKEVGISDVAGETISAFSPLIAGYVLFDKAKVKINEGKFETENVGQAIIGGTIFSAGAAYSVIGAKSLREVALRASGYRAMEQAAKTVSAGFRGARIVGKVMPQLGESVAKALKVAESTPGNPSRRLIVGGSALALALIIYINKNSKDPYDDAIKEGFINTDGKLTPKFDAAFQSQPIEKKKELLDGVAYSWLDASGVKNPETAYENGMYEVIARNKAEAKNLQRAVNGFVDDFAGHALGIVETAIENKKSV